MNYNKKMLGRSFARLEDLRSANASEEERRRKLAYLKAPELELLEREITRSMLETAKGFFNGSFNEAEAEKKKELVTELRMKKAELLTENGFRSDYLDKIVSCPLCNDSGRVKGRICSCVERIYNGLLTDELSALLKTGDERFENFRPALYPEKFRRHMEAVRDNCRSFCESFPEVNSLLFYGEPGLGKTFLSACIAREIAEKGFSVVYDTAVSCLGAFDKQQFSKIPGEAEDCSERVKSMLECDLMILDDLGTEVPAPSNLSALYTLISSRLNSGKATIINTNLSPEDFSRRYSPAISSRIDGYYSPVKFLGDDIRKILK